MNWLSSKEFFKLVDLWTKIFRFRTHHHWNFTNELILSVYWLSTGAVFHPITDEVLLVSWNCWLPEDASQMINISFSSSNTQYYESRIFCLFSFWVFFPDKSFKLISKYTQKHRYDLLYEKEKNTLQQLKLGKLKFVIRKTGRFFKNYWKKNEPSIINIW